MSLVSARIDTPIGAVRVSLDEGVLTGVDLEPEGPSDEPVEVAKAVVEQLTAYFRDGSASFDLPLDLRGTPFQERVWKALRAIPSGETVTYGALARELGTSARAIGGACRANPCPIVVPCHRVVARNGLGGFAGDTGGRRLAVKRWLLRHEARRSLSVVLTVSRSAQRTLRQPFD